MLLSKKPRFSTTTTTSTSTTLSIQIENKNKKKKKKNKSSSSLSSRSNLYAPFRTIGIVTNGTPFQIQKLGTQHFVTTSIGSAFHVYNVEKLQLVTVSDPTPLPITALAVYKEFTFVGCQHQLHMYKRGKLINSFDHLHHHHYSNSHSHSHSHSHSDATMIGDNYNNNNNDDDDEEENGSHPGRKKGNFIQMMVFGEYLVALNDANFITVFLYSVGQVYTTLSFKTSSFHASYFMHPHTYLNKLLIASHQGTLQLWNIKTHQLIYSFTSFGSPISFLAQSPVMDVVAIGLTNGKIILHHLKFDESICSFDQQTKVTAISFRSDEHAVMASANEQGDIAIWDLSKQTLMHQVKNAHRGPITAMDFLVGHPILMTAGPDNSIQQYLFDAPESVPRLLKSRSGHTQPPTLLRFYDDEGKYLLTASKDRALRLVRIEKDAEHIEFSQGATLKKSQQWQVAQDTLRLPPVLALASNPLQQRDWDSIVTCHQDALQAHAWSFERRCLSRRLDPSPLVCTDGGCVTAVAMSPCGHFCVLGSSRGGMDMYNVQSGQRRHTFQGHTARVTGLFMTHVHRVVSVSLDTTVRCWSTKHVAPTWTMALPRPVTLITGHMDTDLVAVVSDDLLLRVIDIASKTLVREWWGHTHCVTDMCFSPDGRWLLSTSLDGSMKTWDVPSAALVDTVRFQHPPVSVAVSPDSAFVATAHVGVLGVCLWTNRTLFAQVALRPLPFMDETEDEDGEDEDDSDAARFVALPLSVSSVGHEGGGEKEGEAAGTPADNDGNDESGSENDSGVGDDGWMVNGDAYVTPEELTGELISLSSQPRSVWMTLLHIDTIKQRNKPKQQVQQPAQAPFFLPTTSGVVPSFSKENKEADESKHLSDSSKGEQKLDHFVTSPFTQVLHDCSESQAYAPFLSLMESMAPSQLDLELQLLHAGHYVAFLESIIQHIQSKRAFELGQAWLHVFLKHHSEPISKSPSTLHVLEKVLQAHRNEWERIEQRLQYCEFLLDFIRE